MSAGKGEIESVLAMTGPFSEGWLWLGPTGATNTCSARFIVQGDEMSSMRILKDHGEHKRGAVISVPFAIGKEMIAAGVAEYLHGGKKPAPVPIVVIPAPKPPESAPEPEKPKATPVQEKPKPAPTPVSAAVVPSPKSASVSATSEPPPVLTPAPAPEKPIESGQREHRGMRGPRSA